MHTTRRTFLKRCSLVTVSSSLLGPWETIAKAAGTAAHPLVLSELDRSVLNFVGTYSSGAQIAGLSVLARRRGKSVRSTRVLVPISAPEDLAGIWRDAGLPKAAIHAAGNTLAFSEGGEGFEIENLLPDAADRRFAQFRTGRGLAFAHDALLYRASDGKVSDPLGAQGTAALQVHTPGGTLASALANVFRGWIEADELDLRLGETFTRLEQRVLNASAARPSVARTVAQVFLQYLTDLADSLGSGKMMVLLRSRIVKTALGTIRGLNTDTLAGAFEALRSSLGEEFPDSSLWLALIFAPELKDGAVQGSSQVDSPDFFQSARSHSAFALAREVVNQPVFPQA